MISFRNAEPKDMDIIMAIEEDCFNEGIQEDQDIFDKRIKIFSDGFILMCEDDEVIGYACGEIWDKNLELSEKTFAVGHNPLKTHNSKGTRFYISSLGILTDKRGGGRGKLLFNTLIEQVLSKYSAINELFLIVAETWEPARAIYKKQGFKEDFVIKNFFEPENDNKINGIVMSKSV